MSAPRRWMIQSLVLCAALGAASWLPAQEAEKADAPALVLKASGLADAATPEALLPSGAVLHARLKSAELLLNDLNAMAVKFIPEKALPPQQRKLLDAPNPLLALVGMQTLGQPLSVEMLAKQSGVDPARPVTLSVYPTGPPDKGFILTLPVRDFAALSQMVGRAIGGAESVELAGGSAQHVQIENNDLYLVCSEHTLCVCGSRQLAQMLLSVPADERLNRSSLITKALTEHADDNLVVVADVEPIKPMLAALHQMTEVQDGAVQQLRQQFLHQFSQKDLAQVEVQLRKYLHVRDVPQLLDYCECVLLGSYEALVEFAMAQAQDFQGIVLTVDVGADVQRLAVTVYSRAIAADGHPLPLAEAAKAVARMPGSHNHLMMEGQSAPAAKSKLVGDVVARIAKRAKAKQLPAAFAESLEHAYADYQPEPTLESKVPWKVTSQIVAPSAKGPDDYPSTQAFLETAFNRWSAPMEFVTVCAIPRQPEGFMAAHFKQVAEASNNNDRIFRRLRANAGLGAPSYTRDSRFVTRQLPGGVTNFVQETSYTTQWGLFGYNEHELINREFTLCRDLEDVTLLSPGGNDPSVLVKFEPRKPPKAVSRMLAALRLPPDISRVEFLRMAPSVLELADLLAAVELKAHKELATYLKQIEAAQKQGGSEEEVLARFRAIEIPILVHHLKQGQDGGFYVVSPGGLAFPRPPIMPEVLGLLEEYRASVDTQGGVAAYQRQAAGRIDVVVAFSTEATATLVRTVGNKIAERYLADREQMERVQGLLHSPRDAKASRDATVLSNPNWDLFESKPAYQE